MQESSKLTFDGSDVVLSKNESVVLSIDKSDTFSKIYLIVLNES